MFSFSSATSSPSPSDRKAFFFISSLVAFFFHRFSFSLFAVTTRHDASRLSAATYIGFLGIRRDLKRGARSCFTVCRFPRYIFRSFFRLCLLSFVVRIHRKVVDRGNEAKRKSAETVWKCMYVWTVDPCSGKIRNNSFEFYETVREMQQGTHRIFKLYRLILLSFELVWIQYLRNVPCNTLHETSRFRLTENPK